jgi:hypothetical protein
MKFAFAPGAPARRKTEISIQTSPVEDIYMTIPIHVDLVKKNTRKKSKNVELLCAAGDILFDMLQRGIQIHIKYYSNQRLTALPSLLMTSRSRECIKCSESILYNCHGIL